MSRTKLRASKFEARQSDPTASHPMDTRVWMSNIDRITDQVQERLSLEGTVVVQRAREIQGEARKLARQRAFLRDERRRARMEEELLRLEIADFKAMRNNDWIPAECSLHPSEKRVRLNVGGKFFEASAKILRRDPGCLLAALCKVGGPLQTELNGTFDIDRDWWTFRLIIKFLRDGVLPADTALLAQLYREAGYWRCGLLRRSIEEQIHLYRTGCGASFGSLRPKMYLQGESPPEKAVDRCEGSAGKVDWWTRSNYNETKGGRGNEEPSFPRGEDT